MKNFIIKDYNIQSVLFVLFFVVLPADFIFKTSFLVIVYFLIAVNHIVSANRRFFSKEYVKTTLFKIYYFISMIFMLSLLLLVILSCLPIKDDFWMDFGYAILFFGLFGTPVLAILYYFICHYDYKKVKQL